jgi:hypothetical protein
MARRHPLQSIRSRLTPRVRRNILVSVLAVFAFGIAVLIAA